MSKLILLPAYVDLKQWVQRKSHRLVGTIIAIGLSYLQTIFMSQKGPAMFAGPIVSLLGEFVVFFSKACSDLFIEGRNVLHGWYHHDLYDRVDITGRAV
jgi:hypothetical protein